MQQPGNRCRCYGTDRSCGDMATGTGSNKIFLPQENPLPEPDRKRIAAEAGNVG